MSTGASAGWVKYTIGDALGEISKAPEALEEISSTFTTVANGLDTAATAVEGLMGLVAGLSPPNYTEALVLVVNKLKNEILNTGGKLLRYWEAPLDDYLYYLRTGKRLYEAKGHTCSYDAFMADLIGSFNDPGDEWRPQTTGEIALTAIMVAAPTLGELGSFMQELRGLFPSDEQLRLVIERIQETVSIDLPAVPPYSTPPDWEPWTLGSTLPVVKDFLDKLFDQIAAALTPMAQGEDAVKEIIELYGLKIARLLEMIGQINEYLAAFAGIMETGGYLLYAASTSGMKGLVEAIAKVKASPEFKVDMYFAGVVLVAEGANVTSFKNLWAGAVPAGGVNPIPEV